MSSDATQADGTVDPAEILRGERPFHRIQNVTDQHALRVCAEFEADSNKPRKDVIAAINERLAELRDASEHNPDDLEWGTEPTYDEALSIAQLFNAMEVRAQLRAERAGVIPGVDEPREPVVRALEQRLEEVSRP